MEKLRLNSYPSLLLSKIASFARAAGVSAALFIVMVTSHAAFADQANAKIVGKTETYRDLINKSRNLSLQHDRLQASRVLISGLQREPKGSQAFKELLQTLDQLSSIFYTEKAQALFSYAESVAQERPAEAIARYKEALEIEGGNITMLKSLARVLLRGAECDKADFAVKNAETIHPYSTELKLLRIQTYECQKKYDAIQPLLAKSEVEIKPFQEFFWPLQLREALRHNDLKKAKSILASWEAKRSAYPEFHYWKWRISVESENPDRAAGSEYIHSCQNMSLKTRKAFQLDPYLCMQKGEVEAFLKKYQQSEAL